jgi:hypothetical protein
MPRKPDSSGFASAPQPLAVDGLDDLIGRLLTRWSNLSARASRWFERRRLLRRRQTVLRLLEASGPLSGQVTPEQESLSLALDRIAGGLDS